VANRSDGRSQLGDRDDERAPEAGRDGHERTSDQRRDGDEEREIPIRVDQLPDARDGLTRLERIILWQLHEAHQETGRESIPTAMLYGRVVEHINISVEEFQTVLTRLVGRGV
jgi:hypothetical protein